MRYVLLLAGLATASAALAPTMAPPTTQKKNMLVEIRRSSQELYANWGTVKAIREEQKLGKDVGYTKYAMVKRGQADRGKLFQLAWYGTMAKWYIPIGAYMVINYAPSYLPSPFETPEIFGKRLQASAALRRQALFDVLQKKDNGKIDDQAKVIDALGAGSKRQALATLTRGSPTLKSIPLTVVHSASKALGGPFQALPRVMHMQTIRGSLRALEEGDAALLTTKLSTLPRSLLAEACNERAIEAGETDSKQLRASLAEWLALTASARKLPQEQADLARLSLLAINTACSTRKSGPTQAPALNALYTKKSF
ncbi:hypothetical protein T492DRAFT_963990 [Pavlovales sp. CCMP2436]|nr:hypothetical protein T492DRAFT_963990 [Pavlovales sp. CCMP2436]